MMVSANNLKVTGVGLTPEQRVDQLGNRNLTRDVSIELFGQYLFATLYSKVDGYTDTLDIVRELYRLSKWKDISKENKDDKLGVDGVAYALNRGYSCFEAFLHSDELKNYVYIEEEHGRRSGFRHVFRYRHNPASGLLQYSWIKRARRDNPYAQTIILKNTWCVFSPDSDKTAKRPARSISGEIISYDVDADSNEESPRSQKSEWISNERSDVRQSPSIPKNAKEKDDDLEFDMKTKWQI